MSTPKKVKRYGRRHSFKANVRQKGSKSLLIRILIFFAIGLFLYLLATRGGNGASWYPGQPFNMR